MNHFLIVKILDLLSFIALVFMLSTGVFLKLTLPPRSGGDEVWGLSRHDWGNIHYTLSIVFLLFVTAHLVVHAKFIKSVVMRNAPTDKYYRIIAGVLGLIALIALAFAPVVSPVIDAQKGHQHYQSNR